MNRITLSEVVGSFAEDKDAAAKLRREVILPALARGESIRIDFAGVTLTTQSFIHALISEALRQHGEGALDRITFAHCTTAPRGIIETVVQYVLESRGEVAPSTRGAHHDGPRQGVKPDGPGRRVTRKKK